jgi:hypothetical protein
MTGHLTAGHYSAYTRGTVCTGDDQNNNKTLVSNDFQDNYRH